MRYSNIVFTILIKLFIILSLLYLISLSPNADNRIPTGNKARYDNYRLYGVYIDRPEQLKVFQELIAESDSYMFYVSPSGRLGQRLLIIVAAHKIAEMTDLLHRYDVRHEIWVKKN